MRPRNGSSWNGWPLTARIGLALLAMVVLAIVASGAPVEAARLVLRLTARTSLVLFALTFTASALVRLAPSSPAPWLRANRRYLGVAFAISHALHAVAIVTLARLDPHLFAALTNPVTFIGGGLAYAFIVAMTLTSFDRTAAWIGRRAWMVLHATGAWYLWLSFALNFGKRAIHEPMYWPAMVVILVALAIRILGRSARFEGRPTS